MRSDGRKMRKQTFYLEKDLSHSLALYCALNGRDMSSVVGEAIQQLLARRRKSFEGAMASATGSTVDSKETADSDIVERMMARRGVVIGTSPELQERESKSEKLFERFRRELPDLLLRVPGQFVLLCGDQLEVAADEESLLRQVDQSQPFLIRKI